MKFIARNKSEIPMKWRKSFSSITKEILDYARLCSVRNTVYTMAKKVNLYLLYFYCHFLYFTASSLSRCISGVWITQSFIFFLIHDIFFW